MLFQIYLTDSAAEFERKTLDLFLEWLPSHMDIEPAEETEAERLADLRDPHLWSVLRYLEDF